MPRILVAGDSLVKYTRQYLPKYLPREFSGTVVTESGVKIGGIEPLIKNVVSNYDILVLHVGTVNIIDFESVQSCVGGLRRLLCSIQENHPGVFIIVSSIIQSFRRTFRDCLKTSQVSRKSLKSTWDTAALVMWP